MSLFAITGTPVPQGDFVIFQFIRSGQVVLEAKCGTSGGNAANFTSYIAGGQSDDLEMNVDPATGNISYGGAIRCQGSLPDMWFPFDVAITAGTQGGTAIASMVVAYEVDEPILTGPRTAKKT